MFAYGRASGSFVFRNLMPTKPRRPCCHPTCSALTSGRYCPTHATYYARQDAYRQRMKAAQRSSSVRREVDQRDQRICQRCGGPGYTKHHIVPLSKGGPDTEANLVTLCDDCHKLVHRAMRQAVTR